MFWYRLKYQGLMDYWGSTQGVHVAVLILSFVAVAAVVYLGQLELALIISKLKFHDDIRRHGSGTRA